MTTPTTYRYAARRYAEGASGDRYKWASLIDTDPARDLYDITHDIYTIVNDADGFRDKGTPGYCDYQLAWELAEDIASDIA
jgi:hypothetical protein